MEHVYIYLFIYIYMLNKETYNRFIWFFFLVPAIHKAVLSQLIKSHE